MKLGKKSRLNSVICAFILVVSLACSTFLTGITSIFYAKEEFKNPISNYQFSQSSNSEFITTLNNWTKVTYDSYDADNYNSGAVKWSSLQSSEDESEAELWDDFKLIEAPGQVIDDTEYDSYLMINAYKEAGRLGYKTSSSFPLDANSYYSIEVTYKTIKATNEKGTSDSFASIYLKGLSNEDLADSSKFENLTTYDSASEANLWATRTFYIATSPYAGENLNLELWLGGENSSQTCQGSVFFSHVDVQRYTESSFNTAVQGINADPTKSLIDLDNDYISLDLIENADFEDGIIYSVPNWTPIHTSMTEDDRIQTINYSGFSHGTISNPKSNESLNNEKGLFMYLENEGNLSMQSSPFTLNKNGYYLISIWANCNSGASNKPSIQLVNLDENNEFKSNAGNPLSIATTISSADANNNRNGWLKYSIYVHTDNFQNAKLAIRLNLTEGYVFFDEVEFKQISMTNYSNGASGSNSTTVDLSSNTSSSLVSNSNFNSISYEGNQPSFPAKATGWTVNNHEDYENYIAGVISTNALDFSDNASNYPNLSNPGNFNELDSNFVLAMGCNSLENDIVLKSNSFELTSKTKYLLTFMAKTQIVELGENAIISFRIYNDQTTIYKVQNITNSNWEKYSLELNTGMSSGSFNIELKIQNVKGYVFFDEIDLNTAPDTFTEGNNHSVVELNSALTDSKDNWNLTSESTNGQFILGTTSAEAGKFDESLSFKGIENPSYIDSNNKEILYIHNENEDFVELTSKTSYSLTAGNYYIVSVYVQTQEILGNGATFKVVYGEKEESFENIISNTAYSKYYFFISPEEATTLNIAIGLGTEENLSMGTAFFDVLTIEELTSEATFETTFEEVSTHSDNVKKVVIATETTDDKTEDGDHDHDHDHEDGDSHDHNDPANVWLAVSSSITALALIIALVGFSVRKIKGKKHTKTKVANNYDRRKTLDKDMDKRERIELRKVMIEDLKKELATELDKFNEYKLSVEKQIEEMKNEAVESIKPIRAEMQKLDKEQDAIEQEHNAKIAVDKRSTTPEEDKTFNKKVKDLEKQQTSLRIKIDKIEAELERKISKLQFNLDLKKMKQDEINDQINSLKEEIADISNE